MRLGGIVGRPRQYRRPAAGNRRLRHYNRRCTEVDASGGAGTAAARLAHYDAITDLASALSTMDEIKRLQRQGAWHAVPDRYSELRRRLIAVEASVLSLTEAQRHTLRISIETFADQEQRVEQAIAAGMAPQIQPSSTNSYRPVSTWRKTYSLRCNGQGMSCNEGNRNTRHRTRTVAHALSANTPA